MQTISKKIYFLEKPIEATINITECGVNALLAGGDSSHIGAVSISDPNGKIITHAFQGHKDHFISEPWAGRMYEKFSAPVVVAVGIHYDGLSKENINKIMDLTKEMLEEILL